MEKNLFGFTPSESAQIRKMAEEAVASGKLLDLKNDAVFKSFFSKDLPESKHCLKSFLEAVTGEIILELEVKNTELTPEYFWAKFPRLDILCKFESDAKKNPNCESNVEMQMTNSDNQKKRSLFYASELYASTLESGTSYRSIPKVFQIMVVIFLAFSKDEKLHHKFMMRDGELLLTDSMQIHFLELPKLEELKNSIIKKNENKEKIDLTKVEFWSLLIAYSEDKNVRMILSELEEFKEDLIMVGSLLKNLSTNRNEWELLYGWEKYNRDKLAYLAAAREEGIEQGIEQGIQQGIQQGVSQGEIQNAVKLALKFMANGHSIEESAEFAEISVSDILNAQK